MIKEEFIKERVIQHKAEGEAFRAVFAFLDEKSKEAEDAGKPEKLKAYKEVEQLLHKREEKIEADLAKLIKQFEYQKEHKKRR